MKQVLISLLIFLLQLTFIRTQSISLGLPDFLRPRSQEVVSRSFTSKTTGENLNGCVVPISLEMSGVPSGKHTFWPIVSNCFNEFYPVKRDGNMYFYENQIVRLSCPGQINRPNKFRNIRGDIQGDIFASCIKGIQFRVDGRTYHFTEFACTDRPADTVRPGNNNEYQIGFPLDERDFLPLINIFYDGNLLDYTYHEIGEEVLASPQTTDERKFLVKGHPILDINLMYEPYRYFPKWISKYGNDTFSIMGNAIDRGHLAPKGDFAFTSQRYATYYYLNANPQFELLNTLNWSFVERSIRGLTAIGRAQIYTGTRGTALMEYPNQIILLTLNDDPYVPVPEYFFKIVRINDRSYAFIGLNIFWDYPEDIEDTYYEDFFCNMNCNAQEFDWLSEQVRNNARNKEKGIVHCCLYNREFVRKTEINVPCPFDSST